MRFRDITILVAMALVFAAGCESTPSPQSGGDVAAPKEAEAEPKKAQQKKAQQEDIQQDESEPKQQPQEFTGEVTREAILESNKSWSGAFEGASVDEQAAKKLGTIEPGARVDVYLGVWCPDSRREVARFWKALDAAGEVPFEVNRVGLDRQFDAGDVSLDGLEIEAVPTFIVYRDGEEVGRVVERSPNNIETDLLALLSGEQSGKISATR